MKKIEQKAIRFIKEKNLIEKGEHLLVSLSGGADSVFALLFLNKFKSYFDVNLSAFHLNHLLRGKDAEADEQFCFELCCSLSIPIYSARKRVKHFAAKNKLSLEEAGREIRYEELERIRKKIKADKIVTAHNSDDNSETILLNLFKGTGLQGLKGIPIKRGSIIRPFLSLEKIEITNYLENNNIPYRNDLTNFEENFTRNLIRHKILLLAKEHINPSVNTSLFNLSEKVSQIEEELLKQNFKDICKVKNSDLVIDVKSSGELNETLFGEMVKKKLRQNFSYIVNTINNRKLFRLIDNQKGTKIELGNGIEALRERDEIIIRKTKKEKPIYKNIKINSSASTPKGKLTIRVIESIDEDFADKEKNVEYVSGNNLSDLFILRNWKNGDKFIPLGMKGFKKISDFLNDEKVRASEKSEILVLENNGNIIWVVGLRIDDRVKITNNTKRKIELCLK
ncbi:MAG: tRNA lysidine(34) synthetase TilS [Melioribacteraceae bacterium]|nr:tRNA lysidine(34) synthetase TilS [Melioribacteraceae bacterium]